MNRKTTFFIVAILGALIVSAGAVSILSPSGDAGAASSVGASAELNALLDQMAPGAIVSKQADGSISVAGALRSAVRAEVQRARELAAAYPTTVRCNGVDAALSCAAVSDADAAAALRAGDTALYGRTIYRSVTQQVTDRAAPMLTAGELVCGKHDGGATMSCSRVDRVQPVIAAGETLFVTYTPYEVTFDAQGAAVRHLTGAPTVPLARATP